MPKRRYNKRSRSKNKRSRVSKESIFKALNGVKSYAAESRRDVMAIPQNVRKFQTFCTWGEYDDYVSILNSSGAIGALGAESDYFNFKFFNMHMQVHVRNLSEHPVMLTAYGMTIKEDVTGDASDITLRGAFGDYLIHKLVDGWDVVLPAAQVDRAGTGTIVDYNDGDAYCSSTSQYLNPSNSKDFYDTFKCRKRMHFKLNPGDDFYIKITIPPLLFNAYKLGGGFGDATSQGATEFIKNHTSGIMLAAHGCLGKNNADETEIGWMNAVLAVTCVKRCKVYQMNREETETAIAAVNLDTLTANTLEGPSEYIQQDEGD